MPGCCRSGRPRISAWRPTSRVDVSARDAVVLAGRATFALPSACSRSCSARSRSGRRRLFRADHVRRRRNPVQDHPQHPRDRRIGRLIGIRCPRSRCFPVLRSISARTWSLLCRARCTGADLSRYAPHPRHRLRQRAAAIRDNSVRVPYLGYNPFWYKLLAVFFGAGRGVRRVDLPASARLRRAGSVRPRFPPRRSWYRLSAVSEHCSARWWERHHHVPRVRDRQLYRTPPVRARDHFVLFVMFLPDGLIGLLRRFLRRRRKEAT